MLAKRRNLAGVFLGVVAIVGLSAVFWLLLAVPTDAQAPPLPRPSCADDPDILILNCLWASVVCRITLWVFAIVFVVGFLMLLAAAFKFATAGGDERAVSGAKKLLTFAIIGLVIALLARVIVFVVAGLLNIPASQLSFFSC